MLLDPEERKGERERERERIIKNDQSWIYRFPFRFDFRHGGQIGPDILTILSQFFSRERNPSTNRIYWSDLMFDSSVSEYGERQIGSTNDHPARGNVERRESSDDACSWRGRREERRWLLRIWLVSGSTRS